MNILLVQESPSKLSDKWIPKLLQSTGIEAVRSIFLFDQHIRHKPTVAEIKEQLEAFDRKLTNEISSLGENDNSPADLVIAMGGSCADAVYRVVFKKPGKALKHLRNRVFEQPDAGPNPAKFCFTYSLKQLAIEPKIYSSILADFHWITGNRHVQVIPTDYRVHELPFINPGDLGLDFETEGVAPYDLTKRLLTGAVCPQPGKGFGFNVGHPGAPVTPGAKQYLGNIFQRKDVTLVGHEIKFDFKWGMSRTGVKNPGVKLWDTKVASALLDENMPDNSLKSLAAQYTDLGHYGDDVDRKDLANAPFEKVVFYNTKDVDAPQRLKRIFIPEIKAQGLEPLCDLMMTSLKVLAKMEHRGMQVDVPWATREGVKVAEELEAAQDRFNWIAGRKINFDAPAQIADVLFNRLNIPILTVSKKTGLPSTSKDALLTLKYGFQANPAQAEGIGLTELIRKNGKLWTTYFVPLPGRLAYDGRIHTTYNLGKGIAEDGDEHGAVTGRLSSSNPNLQNIPIGSTMRGMFCATRVIRAFLGHGTSVAERPWRFASSDYSQLELRIAALLSQDRAMMKVFDDGLDIHTAVLSELKGKPYEWLQEVFATAGHCHGRTKEEGKRFAAEWKALRVAIKRVNFGVLYGIGPAKLSRLLLSMGVIMPESEIRELMRAWFAKYTGVTAWIKDTENAALTQGEVKMRTGRIRRLIGASRHNPVGMRVLRQAVNSPIQATASDVCLTAMCKLDEAFDSGYCIGDEPQARLILQVHDMIGAEFNPDFYTDDQMKSIITKNMTDVVVADWRDRFGYDINVPLGVDVSISERWD